MARAGVRPRWCSHLADWRGCTPRVAHPVMCVTEDLGECCGSAALRVLSHERQLAFVAEQHAEPHLTNGAFVRVLLDWCPPFPGYFLLPSRSPTAASGLVCSDRHSALQQRRRPPDSRGDLSTRSQDKALVSHGRSTCSATHVWALRRAPTLIVGICRRPRCDRYLYSPTVGPSR